jgi:MFS transporter, CP family, cyanate transporter
MSSDQKRKAFLFIAIFFISLNLRPAIVSVGPLIHEIRLDTGLSSTLLGLLTTFPVFAFGVFSVLTPAFTRKFGIEGTMLLALLLLTAGIFLRVIPSFSLLFLGTIILGVGITLGNVLLPGIVKHHFPDQFGLMTGIYSALLGIGAAAASGISAPLSEGLGLGWRWALGVWGFLSLLAFLLWLPQIKRNAKVKTRQSILKSLKYLGTSNLAWSISLFFGMQALTFYTLVAWLPELLIDRGMSSVHAGWMLSVVLITGAAGTFVIPSWASRRERQRLPVLIIVLGEIISILVLLSPVLFMIPFWMAVLGFCKGSSFGMALLFIGLRARDTDSANELSGMTQSVGYLLAAAGPVLFGMLFDFTGGWTIPLIFLLAAALIKLWSGFRAGYNEFV